MKHKLYFPYVLGGDKPIPNLFQNLINNLGKSEFLFLTYCKPGLDYNQLNNVACFHAFENKYIRQAQLLRVSLKNYDLIHTGGRAHRHSRIARISHARNHELKHVHTLRVDVKPDAKFPFSKRKNLVGMADKVTAVSENTAKTAEQHLDITPQVIYNGIDTNQFHANYRRPKLFSQLSLDGPIFLYVGSFEKRKRPLDVIKVAKTCPQVSFIMIGDGGRRFKNVKKEAKTISNLHTVGRIPKYRLPQIYANSTGLVFPSVREGCPNVVLEAMASEIPVVGYQATSMPELVENAKTGFLSDVGDIDALADDIVKLSQNSRSEDLGRNARAYIQRNHSFPVIANQYKELYTGILD